MSYCQLQVFSIFSQLPLISLMLLINSELLIFNNTFGEVQLIRTSLFKSYNIAFIV